MVATNMPAAPDSRPFSIDPRDTWAMQMRAKTPSAKYSTVVKFSEKAASWGAARMRTITEKRPPMSEAVVAQPRARLASPRAAIG